MSRRKKKSISVGNFFELAAIFIFFLFCLGLPGDSRADDEFKGKAMKIEGKLRLESTSTTPFAENDLPQWPTMQPWRSTGAKATSCSPVCEGPVVTENHFDDPGTSFPHLPIDAVEVPYQAFLLPTYGGQYVVEARMQLGHPYVPPDCGVEWASGQYTHIAEDFYIFYPEHSDCVAWCPPDEDTECSPLTGPGECLPPSPSCPCEGDNPGCQVPIDCGNEPVYPQTINFTEEVGFLSMEFWLGKLCHSWDSDCRGECKEDRFILANPYEADLHVECRVDANSPWMEKAGTQFTAKLGLWKNPDNCNPGDSCPGCPRVPIHFPVPSGVECRIYGTVTLFTCIGEVEFDLAELLRLSGDARFAAQIHADPDNPKKEKFHFTVTKGENYLVDPHFIQDDRLTSSHLIKTCSCTPEDDLGVCCGPEASDLHAAMNLIDPNGCDPASKPEIRVNFMDLTLHAQADYRQLWSDGVNRPPRRSGYCTNKLFECTPILRYDPDHSLILDGCNSRWWTTTEWWDPDEGKEDVENWKAPCKEIYFWEQDFPSAPYANYNTEIRYFEGRYWDTSLIKMSLQNRQNLVYMAPISGLHGLLMSDDPEACEPYFTPSYEEEYVNPDHYPNYDDVIGDYRSNRDTPSACFSDGLLETNIQRNAIIPAEQPDSIANFTICPPTDSAFGTLGDKVGDPKFIRIRDYGPEYFSPVTREDVYPTWVPDRTLCSDLANVRGIIRIIDGNLNECSGEVREIGIENPYTLRRHHGEESGWSAPEEWEKSNYCHDTFGSGYDLTTFNVDGTLSQITSSATYGSPFASSNELAPQGSTVFKNFFKPRYGDQFSVCPQEEISSCTCAGDTEDWPAYFGMPELKDIKDDLVQDQILADAPFPLEDLDRQAYGNSETDYHYNQLLALTNNVRATASTRRIDFQFRNDKFKSGLDGSDAPVHGMFSYFDVTKPIQSGKNVNDKFAELVDTILPVDNQFPYITRTNDDPVNPVIGDREMDSQVNPRRDSGWCDSTSQTDPPGKPDQLKDYGDTCTDTDGRTLVDRYTIRPGDCKVENFGICLGEVRFQFPFGEDGPPPGKWLGVEGKGYLNAVERRGAYASARPDLVTGVDIDHDGIDDFTTYDLNEDGVPDQYLVSGSFYRAPGVTIGDKSTVVAFLPAGTYNFVGYSGSTKGEKEVTWLPLPRFEVKCGELGSNGALCSVTSSCSQTGEVTIHGQIEGFATCHVATISYTNTTDHSGDDITDTFVPAPCPPSDWGVLGTYEANIPVPKGCHEIAVTVTFDGCNQTSCSTWVVRDDMPPQIEQCTSNLPNNPYTLESQECEKNVVFTAKGKDDCGSDQAECESLKSQGNFSFSYELWDMTRIIMVDSGNCGEPGNPCTCTDLPDGSKECQYARDLKCGEYRMKWFAEDDAENLNPAACFTDITIVDDTPPTIQNVTIKNDDLVPPIPEAPVACSSSITAPTDPGECTATREICFYVEDFCQPPQTSLSGSIRLPDNTVVPLTPAELEDHCFTYAYPLCTSHVTITAVDGCDETGTCEFDIEVVDSQEPTLDGNVTICGMIERLDEQHPTCQCYSLREIFRRSFEADPTWYLTLHDNCLAEMELNNLEFVDATVQYLWEKPYPGGQVFVPTPGCTNPSSPITWDGGDGVCIRYVGLAQEWWTLVWATVTIRYDDPCDPTGVNKITVDIPVSPVDLYTPNFHIPHNCPDCWALWASQGYPNPLQPPLPYVGCTSCP
jgi:hypothetical protein